MARNLSSLVHELRERIAATSSTPPRSSAEDEALEARFRAVLPNLLHAYVVPSSSASEREVIAVLKLISHTARNFPGVFYHGKASVVLPIIGRILPFFAEPAFRLRHGTIFETVGSLLSLLRTRAQDAYSKLFFDAVVATEDLLHVASVSAKSSSNPDSGRINLRCFCTSYAGISSDPACFTDLPASSKPVNGDGILVDITGKARWQPFATWIIKLLSKCLTDGTLYVEGLISASNLSVVCMLLCYGNADLQMACFDFARITGSVLDFDIIPHENIIQSLAVILSEDKEGLPLFRIAAYDSTLGSCLNALHSSCSDDVVKLTATDFINVFPHSMQRTKSQELKMALCSTYARIAKVCPPHIWRPACLIHMLCFPEPCPSLIDCFQTALSILGPELVGGKMENTGSVDLPKSSESVGLLTSGDKPIEKSRIGEKRCIQDIEAINIKRRKVDADATASDANVPEECNLTHIDNLQGKEEHATYMHTSILSFLELLKPHVQPGSFGPEVALTALSMLCTAFCRYPMTYLSYLIFQQMLEWIPWIFEQVNQGASIIFDISTYMEGVHRILLMHEDKLFKIKSDSVMHEVLKFPWAHTHIVAGPHLLWKTKCSSIQIISKLGLASKAESVFEVLDLGLNDKAEEVRSESIFSMLALVLWSDLGALPQIFKRLE